MVEEGEHAMRGEEAIPGQPRREVRSRTVILSLIVGSCVALALCLEEARWSDPREVSGSTSRALSSDDHHDHGHVHEKPNTAFIMIKGKARTGKFVRLAQKRLRQAGISVVARGLISGETATVKFPVAFGEVFFAAMAMPPSALVPSAAGLEEFHHEYSDTWDNLVLEVVNAQQAMVQLDLTPGELNELWEKKNKRVRLSASVSVGMCRGLIVVNGYVPALLRSYASDATYYMEVKFKAVRLPYMNFTSQIIGSGQNPALAENGTLRNVLYHEWQHLGLDTQPDLINNGIVATDSALMGWLATIGWLDRGLEGTFLNDMLHRGVNVDALMATVDRREITYRGSIGTLFQHFEGLDREACLVKLAKMFPML